MATSATAQEFSLPSGQTATLQEILIDPMEGGNWLRFRFIAPELGEGGEEVDPDAAFEDLSHLCDTFALPYMEKTGETAELLILSLAESATEFGVATPGVRQVFETFKPVDKSCMWEAF